MKNEAKRTNILKKLPLNSTTKISILLFDQYDVIIMQLGNTAVGKSSICQALTGNLNFRIETENGTTVVPRADFIQTDNSPDFSIVLSDVPGINQAVIGKNRRLFVQHPGQSRKILELKDSEDLIVQLTKLMLICL